MRGWLVELLDRDAARAHEIYAAAALDPENSPEDQAIARARLAELDRMASLNREFGARPGRSPGSRSGLSGRAGSEINLGREFSQTLALPPGAERERRLQALRNRVANPDLQTPIQPRPYLQEALRQVRENRSTALARLSTEIARARAAGDLDALRRLIRQSYRLRRPALPRERLDQINRRPLAVIAQRYLQWKTQAARSMTRILRGRRYRAGGDLDTTELSANADHPALLAMARKRLASFIRSADLSAFELQVMESLAGRLAALAEQGRDAEATALLARIPYYGRRFLQPR